jgi:hypothetical protein
MREDEIEIYCNGKSFTYHVPSEWPICSDLAVCRPPNVGKIMESDHTKGEYIMEATTIKYYFSLRCTLSMTLVILNSTAHPSVGNHSYSLCRFTELCLVCFSMCCALAYFTVLWRASLCFGVFHCASLCFTVLHCTSLCFTVLHCASLCFTVLHCASLCFTVLHCATLCYTVLHCASLYFTVLHCASLCFTVLHCASLCFTVLHCATLCYTVLHCASVKMIEVAIGNRIKFRYFAAQTLTQLLNKLPPRRSTADKKP